MPCIPFKLAAGTTGIICTRGARRYPCSVPGCTSYSSNLCDYPVVRAKVAASCAQILRFGGAVQEWVHTADYSGRVRDDIAYQLGDRVLISSTAGGSLTYRTDLGVLVCSSGDMPTAGLTRWAAMSADEAACIQAMPSIGGR